MPPPDPPPPPPQPPPPPTASDIKTDTGSTVQDDLETIQGALAPLEAARLHDPGIANILDTDKVPAPAGQTGDPHRLSFMLPNSDHTVVSIGATGGDHAHIIDSGIRGRTDKHIHWEVALETKTLVSLGNKIVDTEIKGFDPVVPKSTNGYVMITEGSAWHDSIGQHYIVSRTEDVVVRTAGGGKAAVLHSDTGRVSVAAGTEVAIGAKGNIWIGADTDGHVEDKKFHKVIEGEVGKWLLNKSEKTLLTAADTYFSAAAVFEKASDVQKKAKPGEDGWANETSWSKAKFIIDIAKVASTVARYAHDFISPGKVSIAATTYAGLTGNVAASVFGNLSASINSVLSASVLGGTASLKGLLWTSVWSGVGTSIKSIKDVEIKADKGKIKVQGKTDGEISCTDGKLKMTGDKEVQVNSNAAKIGVHGAKGAFIGAGKGTGYGVRMSPKDLFLGKCTDANVFGKASVVSDECIYVGKKLIRAEFKKSRLLFKESEVDLKSDKLTIKATTGKVKIDGNKILIG